MNDLAEIQMDIELVNNWSVNNHLQPNALKTKYMIISRKRRKRSYPPLFLNGLQLEQVSRYKYLGVIVNESLSWSDQANYVSTRAKRTLAYIYRRFCCRSALLKLYSSLVLPILDYNSLVWDPHLLKEIRQLDSVQTFACRMATKNWSASDSKLQLICHLPSLKTRRMYFKLCFLYKSLNHLTHIPNSLFMYRTSGSQRVSHDLQLFCPRANTNSFLISFVCSFVKVWNSLPYNVVHASSIQIFKYRLKQHLVMWFVYQCCSLFIAFCFVLQGFPLY